MAELTGHITIVGCGPGDPALLTGEARGAIERAEVLVGSPRLLEAFTAGRQQCIELRRNLDAVLTAIDSHRQRRSVAVLVSGDPGICSFARKVIQRFGLSACRVVPGITAVQVAFARLGLDWTGARIISAHAQVPDLSARQLATWDRIAILGGTNAAVKWISRLAGDLDHTHVAILCEDLTLASERVCEVQPEHLLQTARSSLAIILLVDRSLLP